MLCPYFDSWLAQLFEVNREFNVARCRQVSSYDIGGRGESGGTPGGLALAAFRCGVDDCASRVLVMDVRLKQAS